MTVETNSGRKPFGIQFLAPADESEPVSHLAATAKGYSTHKYGSGCEIECDETDIDAGV